MRRIPVLAVVAMALASCSSGDGDGAVTGADDATAAAPADTAADAAEPAEATALGADTAVDVAAESADDPPQEEPVDDGIAVDDSCDALTADEISEATGLTFEAGAPSTIADTGSQDACDWVSSDGLTTAQLIVVDMDVFAVNRESADQVSDIVDVEVTGTDEAYSTLGGAIVGMRWGERFVQFAVIATDRVDRSPAVLDLAALAVSRL